MITEPIAKEEYDDGMPSVEECIRDYVAIEQGKICLTLQLRDLLVTHYPTLTCTTYASIGTRYMDDILIVDDIPHVTIRFTIDYWLYGIEPLTINLQVYPTQANQGDWEDYHYALSIDSTLGTIRHEGDIHSWGPTAFHDAHLYLDSGGLVYTDRHRQVEYPCDSLEEAALRMGIYPEDEFAYFIGHKCLYRMLHISRALIGSVKGGDYGTS